MSWRGGEVCSFTREDKPRLHSPKLRPSAAHTVPMSMAAIELRVSAIAIIAAATASQMRGDAESVDGTTIEMKTDAAIALRKAWTRGVMTTTDMIQTPARRAASVTSAINMTAIVAETSSTMAPRPDDAAG